MPTKRRIAELARIIIQAAAEYELTTTQFRRLLRLGYVINGDSLKKALRSLRAIRLPLGDAAEVFGWASEANMLYDHVRKGKLPVTQKNPYRVTIAAMQDLVDRLDASRRGGK